MTNSKSFLSYTEIIHSLQDLRDQADNGMVVFPESFDIILASLENLKRSFNATRAGQGVLSKAHDKLKKAHEKLKLDFKWLEQTKAKNNNQASLARETAKLLKTENERLSKEWTAFRSVVVLQLAAIFDDIERLEAQGTAVDETLKASIVNLWSHVKANEPKADP